MGIKNVINISNVTMVVALAISAIAAYYSIIGLTAIFAGAVIPVIIMGSILEIGKITTTVWLRTYWDKCGLVLKTYLVSAVVALALLTSMGIFGFLSRAHIDQGVPTGDIAAQVSLFDEKIKTEKDNIDLARKALSQMDDQINQRLARGNSEQGAERAITIRRQQAPERAKLQKEIGEAQQRISKLNEERSPVASQLRKVEAEVGPIKYIAALLYGDDPNQNVLERAVRWVTILLVLVFDPLAIALVLASNNSKQWDKEARTKESAPAPIDPPKEPEYTAVAPVEDQVKVDPINEVATVVEAPSSPKQEVELQLVELHRDENKLPDPIPDPIPDPMPGTTLEPDNVVEFNTKQKVYKDLGNGYVSYEGKAIQIDAFKQIRPELFTTTDNRRNASFGTQFPKLSNKGDVFVRVDMLPNKVYKFSGDKWIEVNKKQTDSYLNNNSYIKYLISKIDNGEYDVDLLTDIEKSEIEKYLRENKPV